MRIRHLLMLGLFVSSLPLFTGCSGGKNGSSEAPRINAGGATFVEPIMQKWSGVYKAEKKIEISYVAKGSGYGVEQMTKKTIDFGCSDAPMNKQQVDAATKEGGDVIHIPLIMGSVAIVYNVPEAKSPIKLTGEDLANIYSRKVTKWSQLASTNPGLPDRDIVVVSRAEKSGTTYTFTEYLAKASPVFKKDIGTSTKPKWPEGVIGQEQNSGVAGYVKDNQYSIGYVELQFAKANNLAVAQLKNKAGQFVGPGAEGVTAAAEEVMKTKPTDEPYSLHELTYSLNDAAGEKSYPICGISYAVLYAKQPKDKGHVIVDFLKWAVSDGQKFAQELEYAPLPAELQKKAQERLGQVQFE
jgi:phosphate transport system substrate-binding protein